MQPEQKKRFAEIGDKNNKTPDEWKELYDIFNHTFNTAVNWCETCTGQNANVLNKLTKLSEYNA